MKNINGSSLVAETFYTAECGCCGKILGEQEGYRWRHNNDVVKEDVEKAGWKKIGNLYYCPNCCHYDRQRGRWLLNSQTGAFIKGEIVYVMYSDSIREGIIEGKQEGRRDRNSYSVNLSGHYMVYPEKEIFRSAEALAQYLVFGSRQSRK